MMHLCAFSKSETLASSILEACPLALTATLAKKCICKKRLYHVGPSDLRVLSCTFPLTYKDEPLNNPERYVESLKTKHQATLKPKAATAKATNHKSSPKPTQPQEKQEEFEMDTTTRPGNNANDNDVEDAPFEVRETAPHAPSAPANANGTALTPRAAAALSAPGSAYANITNPMEFVESFGKALYQSKMFGCHNPDQGRILAMACLCEKKNPLEIKRTYHIIGGSLSMRSDAMLAEFNARGGSHEILERTPDRVAIMLQKGRKKYEFAFTWAEAQLEDYIYTSAANENKCPKILADKSVNPKALKDNWSTPRRRMQMMWARLTSDSVRAVDPGVCAGTYTPEELGGSEQPDEAPQAQSHAQHAPAVAPPAAARPAAITQSPAAATPATTQASAQSPTASTPTESAPAGVTQEQLVEMKALKDAIFGQKTKEEQASIWSQVLDRFGVKTARDLDTNDAERVLAWLKRRQKQQTGTDELSKWADVAVGAGANEPAEAGTTAGN